jgi:hypothetical protein
MFCFPILWCNQGDNHPQDNLTKFNYWKIIKKKHLTYNFWLPTSTMHKNMVTFKEISKKTFMKFGDLFFKKPFNLQQKRL